MDASVYPPSTLRTARLETRSPSANVSKPSVRASGGPSAAGGSAELAASRESSVRRPRPSSATAEYRAAEPEGAAAGADDASVFAVREPQAGEPQVKARRHAPTEAR